MISLNNVLRPKSDTAMARDNTKHAITTTLVLENNSAQVGHVTLSFTSV